MINILERFSDKIFIRADGCHYFSGARSSTGHKSFYILPPAVTISAHIFAFMLHNKREPVEDVHHTCHNKWCVNPNHLVELNRSSHMKEHHRSCKRGHDLALAGQNKSGACKVCTAEYNKNYKRGLVKI